MRHHTGEKDGDTRPPDRTALALAKPICGTLDRNAPPRVLGSCLDLGRPAFAPNSDVICALLQRNPHAPGIGQGCAATTSCPTMRKDCHNADSVRIASSLRPDMIFGRDIRRKAWIKIKNPRAPAATRAIVGTF